MDHLCYDCHVFASVHCCLVVTCWERADILALVGDVSSVFVTFPCGILGQVWYLIVSIPDLCHLSYYDTSYFQHAVDWHGNLIFREQDSTDLLMSVRASSIAMEKASHASIKHLTQSFNKHPLKEPYLQCIIKQMIEKSDQKNFVYSYLLWLC